MKRDYQRPILLKREQLGTIAALLCSISNPCPD
jgi:hypothetical protein